MKPKRFFHLYLSLPMILLLTGTACASVLPNGLSLEDFRVKADQPALVGSRVDIEYTLKNLGGDPILLELPGLFVGGRCDGKNVDFGHQQKIKELRTDESVRFKASRILDSAGLWQFWPGFKINGQWGPYAWMEKKLDVFTSRSEAESALKPLSVSQLLSNAARYDNREVTVIGNALIVRKKVDRNKQAWNLISLNDIENRKLVMNVFALGHAPISNGDRIRVTGIFKVKSKRGRYHYDNEIDARKGRIEKLPEKMHKP